MVVMGDDKIAGNSLASAIRFLVLLSAIRLCIVRCYSFDPSVVSIGAVGGRQWVAVDRVLTSCRQLTVLCCLNKYTV